MDASDWQGVALGVAIGGAYGFLQGRDLRRWTEKSPSGRRALHAGLRLMSLAVVLALALGLTAADPVALVVSLAAAYTLVLLGHLKRFYPR